MSTVTGEMARLRETLRSKLAEASALEARLSVLETMPEDPFADGDVVQWSRRFPGGGGTYTYAALKVGYCWYVTGRQNQTIAWRSLVESHLAKADQIWWADSWTELPTVESIPDHVV